MSEKHPLILSASRSSWVLPAEHGGEKDKACEALRQLVLERDKGACYYCGFTSARWQEVHPLDDDHSDPSPSNAKRWATVCPFCHQCFHLGAAGAANGGILIWLPEVSQEQLHHLARAIFVASLDESSPMAASAKALETALESRAQFLERHFSEDASDPAFMGQVFLSLKDDYSKRDKFLKNIRLLPQPSRFGAQIAYWAQTTFRDLPPATWSKLIADPDLFSQE